MGRLEKLLSAMMTNPLLRSPLIVLIIVVVLGAVFLAAVSTPSVVITTGSTDVAGELITNGKPISALAQELTLSSQPGVGFATTQELGWARTSWSNLQYMFFFGSVSNRHVWLRTNNGTQNATATNLWISFASFPECFNLAVEDSRYTASLVATGERVTLSPLGNDQTEVTIRPVLNNLYTTMSLQADAVEATSRLFLSCSSLNLTADNQILVSNGTATLEVDNFGSFSAQLELGVDEPFYVSGPASLALENGNARWDNVTLATSSPTGRPLPAGTADFESFRTLTFTLPGRLQFLPQGGTTYTTQVSGTAVQLLLLTEQGPVPVNPVATTTYWVADSGTRSFLGILASLALGIALSVGSTIILDRYKELRMTDDTADRALREVRKQTRRKARPRTGVQLLRRVVGLVLIVLLFAIGAVAVINAVQPAPLLRLFASNGVALHVYYGNSTNEAALNMSYEVLLPVLEGLLHNNDVSVDFHTFADLPVQGYSITDALYRPVGRQAWNFLGIQARHRVDVYFVHHGSPLTFSFNDGPVTILVGNMDVAPLEEVRLLLSMLGLSWGLLANPCSPIMSVPAAALFRESLPATLGLGGPAKINGVDYFSSIVNRSFVPPSSWGYLMGESLGLTVYRSTARTMFEDVYLLLSTPQATYYEVVRIHSQDLVGNDTWDSVQLGLGDAQAFVRGWAAAEQDFIDLTLAGQTPPPPPIPDSC